MRKISKDKLSQAEMEDEIEYLIHRYEEYMRYHNIKWKYGLIKTIISIPFDVAEKIVKIKWKDAIGSIFSIQEDRLALMKAELGAPGREILFMLKAREHFCN